MEMRILYKNKSFIVPYKKGLEIEEIKKQCQTNFELEKEDINNIILLYVDENKDKIIINNFDELLIFKKGINKQNFLFELFVEINQEIYCMNKLKMKNYNFDEKDKIIIELKKEIENLKKKCENYEKKIKNNISINIIESTNRINIFNREDKIKERKNIINNNETDKKENNNKINNKFKENTIKKCNSFLEDCEFFILFDPSSNLRQSENLWDINDNKNLINQIQINYNEIELVYTKCYFCHKKCNNKIYKDYRGNKYICEICFKKKIKKSDYDNFFEIKFPPQLINYLIKKRKELGNKPVENFNIVLNNIFFDNEGNFKTKEKNEINGKNFFELEKIYNDLILINEDPIKYFADYQNAFINRQKLKFDDNKRNLIDQKIKLVMNNLLKLHNNINYKFLI